MNARAMQSMSTCCWSDSKRFCCDATWMTRTSQLGFVLDVLRPVHDGEVLTREGDEFAPLIPPDEIQFPCLVGHVSRTAKELEPPPLWNAPACTLAIRGF